MSRMDFWPYLEIVQNGQVLDSEQAGQAFAAIMSGKVAEDDLADFLLAMAERPPAISEIVGAAKAMQGAMVTIDAPHGTIDLCGTGGDGHNTFNISTAVSFVVAGCGVPVAKHGNRSASSRSGTADVLEVLGVRIDLPPQEAERCLAETNFCFLFAPLYHTAMKHVGPVRKQIGIRTIFNLLGPLSNPARVKQQLMGVYAKDMTEPLATVLSQLGSEKAWVVHGDDGLDELTTTTNSHAAILDGGKILRIKVEPDDIGVQRVDLSALKGGDAKENAAAIIDLFNGTKGAFRDIVLLNAGAALAIAGKAESLRAGAVLAAEALDKGAARDVLARVAALSKVLP